MVQHPPGVADLLKNLGPYAPAQLPEPYWPGKAHAGSTGKAT